MIEKEQFFTVIISIVGVVFYKIVQVFLFCLLGFIFFF